MKGLELVLEKPRGSGALSPASALAILQTTPPDAVGIHDQTHAIASINSPLAGTKFLERHYVKSRKNAAGHRWVDQK